MDSHFDQVMKERAAAEASGAPGRLYFAYSTILDREAFDSWKTQHAYPFFQLPAGELAEALDVSLVYDFPSRWWGGRVAGLADARGSSIFGRVFEISARDWPIVRHKEGAITGMCVERSVRVRVGDREREATAFETNPARRSNEGPISTKFVDALVRGAEQSGLPADYVERLRGAGD